MILAMISARAVEKSYKTDLIEKHETIIKLIFPQPDPSPSARYPERSISYISQRMRRFFLKSSKIWALKCSLQFQDFKIEGSN